MRCNVIVVTFALGLAAFGPSAAARTPHHYRHYRAAGGWHHGTATVGHHHRDTHARRVGSHHSGGTVTVRSAAGPIRVARDAAPRFLSLIADLVAHGFRGHITCAANGHMPHSLHHSGRACDFAQLARNKVAAGARVMYHAHSIIARHNLRDGCSFHDCGHVDTGRSTRFTFRRHKLWSAPVVDTKVVFRNSSPD